MHAIINNHRQEILDIAHQRGIMNVRVFGSMSRGDAGPDSDVDLLVQLESGRSGLALGGFLMDVSELLGRKVDVVTEKALHPRLRGKIVQEAQPL
jgi:predicted nucleotidyltransferase